MVAASWFLSSVISRFVSENTRSHSELIAGIEKISNASLDSIGKLERGFFASAIQIPMGYQHLLLVEDSSILPAPLPLFLLLSEMSTLSLEHKMLQHADVP